MTDLYLALGSNLGDRERLLRRAVELLTERAGALVRLSAFYETAPWGFVSSHPFLNAVGLWRTELQPDEVLRVTQQVERELGRRHKSVAGRYADRPIDIDILLYGALVAENEVELPDGRMAHLSLPHPLMHERAFVMEPLAEIAPDVEHPVLHRSFAALWDEF